jgi:hypothetical protein
MLTWSLEIQDNTYHKKSTRDFALRTWHYRSCHLLSIVVLISYKPKLTRESLTFQKSTGNSPRVRNHAAVVNNRIAILRNLAPIPIINHSLLTRLVVIWPAVVWPIMDEGEFLAVLAHAWRAFFREFEFYALGLVEGVGVGVFGFCGVALGYARRRVGAQEGYWYLLPRCSLIFWRFTPRWAAR